MSDGDSIMCWPESGYHFDLVQMHNHGQEFLTAALIQVLQSHQGQGTRSVVVWGLGEVGFLDQTWLDWLWCFSLS